MHVDQGITQVKYRSDPTKGVKHDDSQIWQTVRNRNHQLGRFVPDHCSRASVADKADQDHAWLLPGGATDILSRDFAAKLGEELKQQVCDWKTNS